MILSKKKEYDVIFFIFNQIKTILHIFSKYCFLETIDWHSEDTLILDDYEMLEEPDLYENQPEQSENPSENHEFASAANNSKAQTILCDFEGFYCRSQQTMIIKEMCIFNYNTKEYKHYIIETPEEFLMSENEYQYNFASKNFHFIPTAYFTTSYAKFLEVADILPIICETMYTKGKDKANFLSAFFGLTVKNLEDFNAPNYKTLHNSFPHLKNFCKFHTPNRNFRCAILKVHLLNAFIENNSAARAMLA